jgi:deazaflavin-dependent oxidoreductase (nitroreductase family)
VAKPRPMSEWQMRIMRLIVGPVSRFNARRYLASDGRSLGRIAGRDICVASMTGAKSGKRRDVPLMYVPYREGVLLVASLGGAPKHPTWYYNLVSQPDVDVRVKEKTLRLRAHLATPAEKAAVWPTCVEYYPDYANYQARTDRDIPVFICEPRA